MSLIYKEVIPEQGLEDKSGLRILTMKLNLIHNVLSFQKQAEFCSFLGNHGYL